MTIYAIYALPYDQAIEQNKVFVQCWVGFQNGWGRTDIKKSPAILYPYGYNITGDICVIKGF